MKKRPKNYWLTRVDEIKKAVSVCDNKEASKILGVTPQHLRTLCKKYKIDLNKLRECPLIDKPTSLEVKVNKLLKTKW